MRTAVIGAGSIGTIVGGLINYNGGQADLVDVFRPNINAINNNGLKIIGTYDLKVKANAYHIDELEGYYDLAILSVKQTSNSEVLRKLMPHLHDKSIVCTLQNGIPEDSVAEIVGKRRTIGGAVGFGATWIEPGVSMLTSTKTIMDNFAFEIGEITGEITERLKSVQKILNRVGNCTILDNLMGVRWAKVLMNSTFSGMSAALGCTFGDVLNDSVAIKCVANIANEVIKVSKAEGVEMAIMQGKNFAELELDSQADIESKISFYHEVWDQHALLKASMLQDLEKGRKTEINFINGVVCEKGRQHGIPTPFNEKVVELVTAAENRKTVNTMECLKSFSDLLKNAK